METQKRTVDDWFRLWDVHAGVRRKIREQRWTASASENWSEYETLSRAYDVADKHAEIAYIRYLMEAKNLSMSDVADFDPID